MECCDCAKKIVLFKCKDGEYRCIDCMKKIGEALTLAIGSRNGEYIVKCKLRDNDGKEWIEEMKNMTLSDFEEYYGTITNEILWFTIRLHNHALI